MKNKVVFLILVIVFLVIIYPQAAEAVDAPDEIYEQPPQEAVEVAREYFRGRVLTVENIEVNDGFAHLEQNLEVKITSGPYEDEVVTLTNYFKEGEIYLDLYLEEGDTIIMGTQYENGELIDVYLHDIARDQGLIYILLIFIFLLLLVGRMQGLKTIVTLAFTGIVIFFFLLPQLLAGHEPLPLSIISAGIIVIFTLLVIGGINVKSFSAIIGTVCGVIVAGLLALWVGEISSLTGFGSEEAQMLYYMEHELNIRGLLFAGIIIGSLGAVTDVGISVASAAAEIKEANPRISCADLTRAAMNVGRDIMGTMANTLILAYVGAALPLLLLIMGFQDSWLRVINMDMIATEFVRGMAGSIGLIIAIPISALAAGLLMGRK